MRVCVRFRHNCVQPAETSRRRKLAKVRLLQAGVRNPIHQAPLVGGTPETLSLSFSLFGRIYPDPFQLERFTDRNSL